MGLRINTNVQALVAHRFLTTNAENQKSSLEHLASGSRINRAGDDAAGLAISEKLKAEIRSIRQANRNANDGISLIQVAEGGMNEISNILVRMKELSVQSASDTIGDTERSFVHKEIKQLKSEIDRIANVTEFDGHKLLDGKSEPLEIQIGTKNNPTMDRMVYHPAPLAVSVNALNLDSISVESKESSQQNLTTLDSALDRLNGNRATLGALQNRMNSTINNLAIYKENLESANSRIRDTDMAEASSELIKQNILTQTNVSVLSQANQSPQLALKLLG
jgi:flagellin